VPDAPFFADQFRAAGPPVRVRPPSRPPRHVAGEKFLKGPIPWAWLATAIALPGRALAVGLVVWFEAGCKNSRTVSVTLPRFGRAGLPEGVARRGLKALEGAGLIAIDRPRGRGLRVTILAGPRPPDGEKPESASLERPRPP
jgi:hypothetical protein